MSDSLSRRWLAALLHLCLLVTAAPVQAWWNEEWTFRKRIEIDAAALKLPPGASVQRMVVPVRLHNANFGYFLDLRDDAADVRFLAADDLTPLPHHVEVIDVLAGIAVFWVQVPQVPMAGEESHFWMYYGNAQAGNAADAAGTWDAQQALVLHFAELTGLPRDASAFANHPVASTATAGEPGVIDKAVKFGPDVRIELPPAPTLSVGAGDGFTFSAWLLVPEVGGGGTILRQGGDEALIEIGLDAGRPYARVRDTAGDAVAVAAEALVAKRWTQVAVTLDGTTLRLHLNGREAATAPAVRPAAGGAIALGAAVPGGGFTGTLDEVRLATVARTPAALTAIWAAEVPEGQAIVPGADETAQTESRTSAYLQLVNVILEKMSLDGWVIIAVTLLLGLVALDVAIGKLFLLGRAEHGDSQFMEYFRAQAMRELGLSLRGEAPAAAGAETDRRFRQSGIARLYRIGLDELAALRKDSRGKAGVLAPAEIEIIRAALDIGLVHEVNRLNARLVMITLAVSGAPFLGLLGTVLGVMITFTTIAASGDVNVATIAPGIASAMGTTVVGLFVAIPALFAYNWLATRVARIIGLMEMFGDQFLSAASLAGARQAATEPPEVQHAA